MPYRAVPVFGSFAGAGQQTVPDGSQIRVLFKGGDNTGRGGWVRGHGAANEWDLVGCQALGQSGRGGRVRGDRVVPCDPTFRAGARYLSGMSVTHVAPPAGVRMRVRAFQLCEGDLVPFADDEEWLTVESVRSGRDVTVQFNNGVVSTSSSQSWYDVVRP